MDYLVNLVETADWQFIAHTSDKENVADLIDLYDVLSESYDQYLSLVGDFSVAPPDSQFMAHKDLLVEYYEQPPVNLKAVIQNRRNGHGLSACPSCGSPFKPNTLDHFLPKDKWPEYSIYPNNLVPQCIGCAPIKGKRYYCDEALAAMFINPIYSDLLSKVRFGVDIEIRDGAEAPEFTVKLWAGGLSGNDLARVRRHLEKLDIHSRMQNFFLQEFFHWKRIVSEQGIDIRPAMEQRIAERVTQGDRPSEWKSAFCKGVLESPSVIEFYDALHALAHPVIVDQTEYVELTW